MKFYSKLMGWIESIREIAKSNELIEVRLEYRNNWIIHVKPQLTSDFLSYDIYLSSLEKFFATFNVYHLHLDSYFPLDIFIKCHHLFIHKIHAKTKLSELAPFIIAKRIHIKYPITTNYIFTKEEVSAGLSILMLQGAIDITIVFPSNLKKIIISDDIQGKIINHGNYLKLLACSS